MLNASQLRSARSGTRTHICRPAHERRGRLSVLNSEDVAPGLPIETIWTTVAPGDRLWVQEEQSEAYNLQSPLQSRLYWAADCINGRASIPGGFRRGKWEIRTHPAAVLSRAESRYTLLVTGVRLFQCQEITTGEISGEGSAYGAEPVSVHRPWTLRKWWEMNYGIVFPWDKNPVIVGIWFQFLAETIDGRPAPRVEGFSPLPIGETRKQNPVLAQWRAEDEARKAAQAPDAAPAKPEGDANG